MSPNHRTSYIILLICYELRHRLKRASVLHIIILVIYLVFIVQPIVQNDIWLLRLDRRLRRPDDAFDRDIQVTMDIRDAVRWHRPDKRFHLLDKPFQLFDVALLVNQCLRFEGSLQSLCGPPEVAMKLNSDVYSLIIIGGNALGLSLPRKALLVVLVIVVFHLGLDPFLRVLCPDLYPFQAHKKVGNRATIQTAVECVWPVHVETTFEILRVDYQSGSRDAAARLPMSIADVALVRASYLPSSGHFCFRRTLRQEIMFLYITQLGGNSFGIHHDFIEGGILFLGIPVDISIFGNWEQILNLGRFLILCCLNLL
jgi:hypothetical protein